MNERLWREMRSERRPQPSVLKQRIEGGRRCVLLKMLLFDDY